MHVNPVPAGFHTVTPYLTVEGADKVMAFMKEAFGAVETERVTRPDGKIGHAQVKIGDSMVMLAEASGEWKAMPSTLYLYVPDVDAVYAKAVEAGGTSIMAPMNMFYGDRSGGVKDSSGNCWWIGTHVEDVSKEELQRRAGETMKKSCEGK